MIIVQARIPVQSDCRNIAYQHIHDFVNYTRAEQGCVGCEAYVSLEDPDILVIHQAWRAADDLDQHASGEGLEAFLEALPLFVAGEISTLRYDAVDDEEEGVGEGEGNAPEEVVVDIPLGVTFH